MNELAARKQLLIRQSQLYREMLVLERLGIGESVQNMREQFDSKRWWLVGGVAVFGWLFANRLGGMARWLPPALAAARFVQRLRS